VLQKLKNETDSLVKSANIFSLAKKSHSHAEELTNLDIDPVVNSVDFYNHSNIEIIFKVNQINGKTESVTVTARSQTKTSAATTPKIDLIKTVKIFPNSQPTAINPTSSILDFFDNEISNVSEENIASPTSRSSTIEYSTKFTSSAVTKSVSAKASEQPETTVKLTEKPVTTVRITEKPSTTTEVPTTTVPSTTTENYIARNYRLLQQLLAEQTERNRKSSNSNAEEQNSSEATKATEATTERVTVKETPRTTQSTTQRTTTLPPTTREVTTTQSTTVEPTTRQSTTRQSTTQKRTTQSTTESTTEKSTTQSTTTTRSTTIETTTAEPSTVYTKSLVTTEKPKKKAPFSDAEDLAFLVSSTKASIAKSCSNLDL
jgi:hypothetical protein